METYNGHVRTPNDAIILFEACRLGLLPRVQRRLSEKERQSIRTGSVFVWDEREAGMRRWTDGKSWSASRVSGSFLTYREMEGKRGGNNFVQPVTGGKDKSPADGGFEDGDGEEGPDGYRYKPDGLMKQSFSLTTSTGQHLHLISYYSRSHPTAHPLRQPSNDPQLSSIQIPKGMYPESTIADASNTPAVTRSPMPGAPNYVLSAGGPFGRPSPAPAPPPGFIPGYSPYGGYMYPHMPMSPLHTPPGHYPMHYAPVYYPHPAFAHPAHHPQAHHLPPPPPPHHLGLGSAPPSHWDQRPLRAGMPTGPLPPVGPLPPAGLSSVSRSPPRTTLPVTTSLPPVQQDKPAQDSSNPQSYPMTPGSDRASSTQIDPRLDAPRETILNVQPPPLTTSRSQPEPIQSEQAAANQAPSITSLVNAAAQASPLPTRAETEPERKSSSSPGDKRHESGIQDIPTNKFPFGGDSMALRKLDRAFGIK